MHIIQLTFRSGLKILDVWCKARKLKWTYYAGLTKLVHVWRDFARAIFLYVLGHNGASLAMRHAKKLPPKCIAGRWGTVYATETIVSSAGRDVLQPAIDAILTKKLNEDTKFPKPQDPMPLEDVSNEDAALVAGILDPQAEDTSHHRYSKASSPPTCWVSSVTPKHSAMGTPA
jgi:hypothetical protein